MKDLEHNQYDEYSPPVPEQAPLPNETQENHEYQAQNEQQSYAEHAQRAASAAVPPEEEKKKKRPKPQPPVSRMAMQFVAISSAAVVTVTAGAVLSNGAFLPELGVWAKETVEQLADMPTIAAEQPAMDLQEIAETWTGDASGAQGDSHPGETSAETETPPDLNPGAPQVETLVPEPIPVPITPEQPVKPIAPPKPVKPIAPPKPVKPIAPPKPVKPIAPPKPVKPIAPPKPVKPIVPPKPVEPPIIPPIVPPVEPPVEPPIVPPVEPPVNPPYEPDTDPAPDPPHVHSYTASLTTPATCGAAGVTTYTCSCGHSYTAAEPAATGLHTLDAGVVTAPSCTAPGYTLHTCTICGSSVQDTPTARLPHTVVSWSPGGDGLTHTGSCSVCGQAQTENHSLVDGVKTPATCLAVGVATHICSACHFAAAETELAMLPHSFGAWTKVDEINHYRACTTPGCTVSETAAHSVDRWTDKTDAQHEGSCSVCAQLVLADHDFSAETNCPVCGAQPGKFSIASATPNGNYYEMFGAFTWKNGAVDYAGLTLTCTLNMADIIERSDPLDSGATSIITKADALKPGDTIAIEVRKGGNVVATNTYTIAAP